MKNFDKVTKNIFCRLGIHTEHFYRHNDFEKMGREFLREDKICEKCGDKIGERWFINILPKGTECGDWRKISLSEIKENYESN